MDYIQKILTDRNILKTLKDLPRLDDIILTHPNLPNTFVPASDDFFKEQFYWDSFFIMQGLVEMGGEGYEIMRGMVENFFSMINEYGYVPNSYNTYDTRSQPPFLSSMVLLVYGAHKDKKWLRNAYRKVLQEYEAWTTGHKNTITGLSRYNDDRERLNRTRGRAYGAIQESGWDMTLRFGGRAGGARKVVFSKAHHVCPIDLNSLLYKYEKDLSIIAANLDYKVKSKMWTERAEKRKSKINELMWDESQGLFFDYDYLNGKRLNTRTGAAYFPLWVGLASPSQADKLRDKLKLFERENGLACTDKSLANKYCQWSYPNGWAPLHWITVMGLRNYGFHNDANRIAYKWLKLNANRFIKNGEWGEKLCVDPKFKRIDDPRYAHQAGANWSIGVFISLYRQIEHLKNNF